MDYTLQLQCNAWGYTPATCVVTGLRMSDNVNVRDSLQVAPSLYANHCFFVVTELIKLLLVVYSIWLKMFDVMMMKT